MIESIQQKKVQICILQRLECGYNNSEECFFVPDMFTKDENDAVGKVQRWLAQFLNKIILFRLYLMSQVHAKVKRPVCKTPHVNYCSKLSEGC